MRYTSCTPRPFPSDRASPSAIPSAPYGRDEYQLGGRVGGRWIGRGESSGWQRPGTTSTISAAAGDVTEQDGSSTPHATHHTTERHEQWSLCTGGGSTSGRLVDAPTRGCHVCSGTSPRLGVPTSTASIRRGRRSGTDVVAKLRASNGLDPGPIIGRGRDPGLPAWD